MDQPHFHDRADAPRLAYRRRQGSAPTLVFLPGYASDMDGAKAQALDDFAARRGLGLLRFDYSGTGLSGGTFAEGRLDRWLGEALLLIDTLTEGPLILAGSSMGGWLALHLALRRAERVSALLGIAAAPDFTDWGFGDEERAAIMAQGWAGTPDPGGAATPDVIHRAFWQSGQALRLLDAAIPIDCPVRLVHGEKDQSVPLAVAHRLMDRLRSADVQLTIVKGGGHRLSEPREIAAILGTVAALLEPAE